MTHLTGFPCPLVRSGSRRSVAHHKRIATPRAVKGSRPPRAIKWIIISAPWYCAA